MLVLVTSHRDTHGDLLESLIQNGIFTYVTSPTDAMQLVHDKDTGGVVLDCMSDLTRGEQLCANLRTAYPQIPIAAITARSAVPNMKADRFLRGFGSTLLAELLDFCISNCGWKTARLSTPYLTVCQAPEETLYMGDRLNPSPHEHRILRCLFYRAPFCMPADDLIALCFPFSDKTHASLAVQIARLNKRAVAINSLPLIVFRHGRGYSLRDGILPHAQNESAIR